MWPDLFFINGKFLGIEWHFWKFVGWAGNAIFFTRFLVQWWATEKKKRVVVPNAFWWLSLAGSMCLFAYGLYQRDSVFIFAYAFTWLPYIRNLMISSRQGKTEHLCPRCAQNLPQQAKFCSNCGQGLNDIAPGLPTLQV